MKKKNISELAGWDDVNDRLAWILENQLTIERINFEMEQAILAAKEKASEKAEKYLAENKRMESEIRKFTDAHRTDFGEKKMKTLTFGSVGYRGSKRIMIPKEQDKQAEIIRRMRELRMNDCIVYQPDKIDRDVLSNYSAEQIAQTGAVVQMSDKFWLETDRTKINKT